MSQHAPEGLSGQELLSPEEKRKQTFKEKRALLTSLRVSPERLARGAGDLYAYRDRLEADSRVLSHQFRTGLDTDRFYYLPQVDPLRHDADFTILELRYGSGHDLEKDQLVIVDGKPVRSSHPYAADLITYEDADEGMKSNRYHFSFTDHGGLLYDSKQEPGVAYYDEFGVRDYKRETAESNKEKK